MRCSHPTKAGIVAAGLASLGAIAAPQARAQDIEVFILEEITVTATKRVEALQDVPISVATLQGERYEVLFSGSDDVLALSGRVPGLYAESSNGRTAPRFYLRGLGNIDFDLAASQPVSLIMDDVVMENVVLKSFPLFDMAKVEVIRGPQSTLFGRNTTAGIVKFDTRRPSHETSGYAKVDYGTYSTLNLEGAIGGSLVADTLAARLSVLGRTRDDWITNGQTGEESLGEYEDYAARAQFLWTPSDSFSGLLSMQTRSLDGTSSIFRANVFDTGSNDLNQNYDRELVYYDDGDNNPQAYDSNGLILNLTWDLAGASIQSITAYQEADGFSRGDIDGGTVDFTQSATPPPGVTSSDHDIFCVPGPCVPVRTWPGRIEVPSVTQDGADVDQFTQEFRIASNSDGPISWQAGAFFFDSTLEVTTESFASFGFVDQQDTIIEQKNTSWAVFGQGSFDLTDALTLTAGLRYTYDEKDFRVIQFPQLWLDLGIPTSIADPINVDDDQTNWEVSLNWAVSDESSLYARAADGFRAQTIQGRDVAFLQPPTVADAETITSLEGGWKADFAGDRMRINAAIFWYEVDDMQLSVIGGAGNIARVINAEKGEAIGFEIEGDFLLTDNLLVSAGASYNDTEIKDPDLVSATCGSGLCTPTDPVNPAQPNEVFLDGNPFPRAPETTYNLSLRWGLPVGRDGEIYVFTDWVWYGQINMPLYESLEFVTDGQYEGGLRVGYQNDNGWDFAVFGRNITDEDNVIGFIDFSNNTGFVNEPQMWGVEVRYDFGD